MRLAASVLSFDLLSLRETLPELERSGAEAIHLDVMDGGFVPPITFGAPFVRSLRPLVRTPFEAHLMVESPERHFDALADAGCFRLIFHAEATRHAYRHAQTIREMGLQAGVAINPGSPVELLRPLLPVLDLALIMTVNPGWGGQEFLPENLDKVRALRAWAPSLTIEVDGGIDPGTIGRAAAAGVDLFVVGSFLAEAPELGAAVAELREACFSAR